MSKNSGLNFPGIYTITRIASGSVYVGQATNIRIRWQHHNRDLRRNRHRNFVLQRAWNEHGPEAFVFAVVRDMSDVPESELAAALNEAEIELLAASPSAYNLMEAGQSGTIASAGTRERLSIIRKAQWTKPEYRAKHRASMMALYADPEWTAARNAAVKESKNSAKTKAEVSRQMKALWQTPEHKAAQSARRAANWQDPEYRERQLESRKKSWADPESRKRRMAGLEAAAKRPEVIAARKAGALASVETTSKKLKAKWQDQDFRDRQSASRAVGQTNRFADPVEREAHRVRMKESWARRKAPATP